MRLLTLVFLLTLSAFAQSTGSIATSVSRAANLTADEADFSITAGAGLDATQQQVTQVFLDAGVSNLILTGTSLGQNYTTVVGQSNVQTLVFYQFTFSVPASGLISFAKIMESLRTNPPAVLQSFQYSAALNVSQATADAMNLTLLPQLLSDAQKKAQALATAAGLKLGAIQSVSESYNGNGASGVAVLSGIFSTAGTITNSFSTTGNLGTQFTFTANVTYAVGQ